MIRAIILREPPTPSEADSIRRWEVFMYLPITYLERLPNLQHRQLYTNTPNWLETYMNVYGLHEKTDLLMCTARAKKLFTKHDSRNTQVSMVFFLRKSNFGFPCCCSYSWRFFYWCINYYCRTDIDEARAISFLGVRTDRHTRFWNPHLETCRHTKIFSSKLKLKIRS